MAIVKPCKLKLVEVNKKKEMAIIKIRKEVGKGEEKKIEEKDAWDPKIGLGYPDKATGKDVINLKITKGSTTTYVPFQKKNDPLLEPMSWQKILNIDPNAPISGYAWSTVSNLRLKKDSNVYYPIRKLEFIKFKITLNPGPYNTPGEYSREEYAADSDGAFATVEVLSASLDESRNIENYYVVLFGYATRNADARTTFSGGCMQTFYCALASAKVTNNKGGNSWCNAISKDWSYQYGPWDWFSYGGGYLTDTVTLFWKIVESSGSNEHRVFSLNSGEHYDSRGGRDAWIDGNGTKTALGSYFSYQYGKNLENPCADGFSCFYLANDGSDNVLMPILYVGSSTTWNDSWNAHFEPDVAKLTIKEAGSVSFSNIQRQYLYHWKKNTRPEGATPEYIDCYTFKGSSSRDLTMEVVAYLD